MVATRFGHRGSMVLLIAGALLIFAIDVYTEAGYIESVAYVAVVLGAYSGGRRQIWLAALACSLLTVAGYFLQPPADNLVKVLTNRTLALFAIWVTAVLCLRRRVQRQRETEWKQTLDARNRQLQQSLAELQQARQQQEDRARALLNVTEDLTRANAALKRQALQRHQMAQAGLDVNAATSIEEMMQTITDHAREILGAHQATTSFTLDHNWTQAITGLSLSDKYASYRTYNAPPDGSGIYSLVCETNRPIRLTQAELEAHPRWRGFGAEAARHPPMRGWLAVPLISRAGKNLGLIQVSDRYEGEFTLEDQLLLVQLAQLGAIAVEVRRFQEELEARVQQRTAEVRFLSDVVEQSTQPFAAADFQGRLIRFNRSFERLTGYSDAELRGMNYLQLTPERWHAVERLHIEELIRTHTPQHYEKEYRTKDGRCVPIELVVDLYRNAAGEPECLYAFVTDITERKTAEQHLHRTADELMRSNTELEQFAYIASHDLQEPLRKVRAFGDMLLTQYREALGEEGQDYLQRMQNASKRMQALINDLLAYSRVTTKGQPFEEVDLGDVVRQVVGDLEIRISETHGRVEVESLPTVEADPLQMRQLFQNLIGNALKFHRKNEPPLVRVYCCDRVDEKEITLQAPEAIQWIVIEVADNGIGFEEKYLDRIFAPFQRLHGRGEYEGTGIGLAICRKIVERHGGSLTAVSAPDRGATFQVTLPARQAKARTES